VQYRPTLLREGDRYRGRRRAPAPPRSRYLAVVTTAFVGAGVVAFGAGAGIKDAKTDALVGETAASELSSARLEAAERAGRGEDRSLSTSIAQSPNAWVLPNHDYRLTSLFGQRWGKAHKGVDIAVPEGTPVAAMHEGIIVLAAYNGGYGNQVIIDHGNGIKTTYGHNSRLMVKEGQRVKAGDIIAISGSTGHSTGPHVHLEIHVNDVAVNPLPWFKAHGVDLELEIEQAYDGSVS
jgi:murein DD-endopeptidase MepM/ murein hydrolase activator NlpD